MNISIIGSDGFIAKNFFHFVKNEKKVNKIYLINKKTTKIDFLNFIKLSDKIFVFAGINRTTTKSNYSQNLKILKEIISVIHNKKKIFFMSSIQSSNNSSYGKSKKKCEEYLLNLYARKIIDLKIYKLPNIFGKWSKPNYNSVVATFCYNIINNKTLKIKKNKNINLLYIDDLIKLIISDLKKKSDKKIICDKFKNIFKINVLRLKKILFDIHKNYKSKIIINYNLKLYKYLYSTYLSYLSNKDYKYLVTDIKKNKNGSFLELFKSKYFGQISLLEVRGKNTRGNHFHHTKFEKFLVIHGKLKYVSKSMIDNNKFSTIIDSNKISIVNTIPGHFHYLENFSKRPAKVLIWSNEIFNKNVPDTFN